MGNKVSLCLSHMSVALNEWLTGDTGKPLCYTAYDRKSVWYRIFDFFMFWDPQHCRKTWLSRRIHDRPLIYLEVIRDKYKTREEWERDVHKLDAIYNEPCQKGYHWIRSESYNWTPEGDYKDWKITLSAVRDKDNE